MRTIGNLTFVFALAAGIQPLSAQSIATSFSAPVPATCHFPRRARIVTSLRELPEVSAEFERQKLAIADVGEKFIPFDVEDKSNGLPHRQFVRAYVFSDQTIVWYYRGGFGASFHVVELKVQRGTSPDETPSLRLTDRSLSGPFCAATEAMLAGVNGGQGW